VSSPLLVLFWVGVFGVIAVIDLRTRRIPDALLVPAAFAATLLAALHGSLVVALAAGVGAFVSFWLLRRLSVREGNAALGGGDVKLAGLIGLACGPSLPMALLVGTGIGAALALALLLAGRPRRSFFPYGPALAVGAVVAILAAS
jgi:leader peptidase (prepilin peptidase)/N-methyltransferase